MCVMIYLKSSTGILAHHPVGNALCALDLGLVEVMVCASIQPDLCRVQLRSGCKPLLDVVSQPLSGCLVETQLTAEGKATSQAAKDQQI